MLRNLVVLLFAASLPSQTTTQPAPVLYEDPEAYAVYSSILAMGKQPRETFVADTTVSFNQCLPDDPTEEVGETVANYKEANQTRRALKWELRLPGPYKLVPFSDKLFAPSSGAEGNTPSSFRVYRFSAVGFNQSKTLALVVMDFVCGKLCGQGQALLLEKKKEQWVKYDPAPRKSPDGSLSSSSECLWIY